MNNQLPPNSHNVWIMATITLPEGESPTQENMTPLFAGGHAIPCQGAEIHNIVLIHHRPIHEQPEAVDSKTLRRARKGSGPTPEPHPKSSSKKR